MEELAAYTAGANPRVGLVLRRGVRVLRIGEQIEEAVAVHQKLMDDALSRKARELLEMVRIPDAAASACAQRRTDPTL